MINMQIGNKVTLQFETHTVLLFYILSVQHLTGTESRQAERGFHTTGSQLRVSILH